MMKMLKFGRLQLLPAPPEHRSRGWRRRSAGLLLLLVLIGTCGYWYLTRESRLTAMASSFLQDLAGGDVRIGRVNFSFFGGLHVTDVTVRTPGGAAFGPAEGLARVIFHAADVELRHRPLSLLVGRFDVERIVALRPEFLFVTDRASGRSNWQTLMRRPESNPGGGGWKMALPRVELRSCVLRSGVLDGQTLRLAEPLEMDLAATPAAGEARAYSCVLRPLGQDRLPRTIRFDVDSKSVEGNLPGIQIAQFQLSLPAAYARWCDILELTGQIGAEDIEYNPSQGGRCAVNLSHVSLSVPVNESEYFDPAARSRRMMRLNEVTGRIVFEPTQVRVDIAGRFNGERMRIWGTFTNYVDSLRAMGYDLQMETGPMPLPNSQDPYVVNQISAFGPRILKLLHEFEPTAGTFRVQGHLVRPAGEDAKAKFNGVIETYEAAGRYDDFPYHGERAHSTIRLTDDGIFFDILAWRGPAVLQVKGWVEDGSSHTDVDVTVETVDVPLDDEMYRTLPPKFQKLWQHFTFYGRISCQFRLWRKGGTPQKGAAPWNWTMHMTLHDVAARYEGFQFMEWGINGTLDAADGLISKIDLKAIRLNAVTRITGTADLRDSSKAVDLRITAKNRPLTADILLALPERVRDLVRDWSVKGLFDIDAAVKLSKETNDELLCQADLKWHEGSALPRQFGYPLQDVQGRVWMDQASRRVEVREITARNGRAKFRAAGAIDLQDKATGRFELAADDLPLDDRLYQALPAGLQHWWQAFEPKGLLGVRSEVAFAETEAGTDLTYRTSLLLAGNEACWDSFPLSLKDINGKVVLSAGRCEVQDLTGTHEGGLIRASGAVDWDDTATRAAVRVWAKDMPLNEPLRRAVPWQIRRMWNTWSPAGQMDLDLTSLHYVKPKGAGATWDLEGSLAGRLQKLDLSVEVQDAVLRSTLAVHIDEDKETFEGHGKLEAERAVLSMIPVTDAQAYWGRTADGTFRLRNFQGKALGGELSGFFEIEPTRQGERYGVVLSLDHADPSQLAEILTHGQMNGVAGTIQMQMRLRGLVDQPETRSGAAEVKLVGQGLYRLPVLLQIANVLNIPLASEARDTQQLSTKLTLIGDQAILESLELRDGSFLMLGNGAIDIPTRQASLTVIAARPRTWPKVPVFTELLEGALRELIEVHGSGPINDLKFEAKALRSVQGALQTLATRKHEVRKPARIPKVVE